jgi:SAM-dependent methyltransferase
MCGSRVSRPFLSGADRVHDTPGTFHYRLCASCSSVFQDPRVLQEDLALCYARDYYTHQDPGLPPSPVSEADRPLGSTRNLVRRSIVSALQGVRMPGPLGLLGRVLGCSRWLRQRAFYDRLMDELLPRSPERLKALDIGCGNGYLLSALDRAGWDAEGVEWDATSAEFARSAVRKDVRVGDFFQLDLPLNHYSLVSLSHVFEHLPEPRHALKRIAELLKTGGIAVLIWPNPHCVGAKFFKADWRPWEVPRHIVLPAHTAVMREAINYGLQPVSSRTLADHALQFFEESGNLQTNRTAFSRLIGRRLAYRALEFWERFLVLLGRPAGEEIVVVLKKATDSREKGGS